MAEDHVSERKPSEAIEEVANSERKASEPKEVAAADHASEK